MLVDSMRPCERPYSRFASIASRWFVILLARWMNDSSCDRRVQDNQRVEGFFAVLSFDSEHVAEPFFEEIGSPQFRIGFGDPVELLLLAWVEVVGVLPQCVAGSGDLS